MREFEVVATTSPLSDAERQDVQALESHLRATIEEAQTLESSGLYTDVGLAQQPRPRREAALRAIGAFEQRVENERLALDETTEAIASGRRVRSADGAFVSAPLLREPTAASETRALAIVVHLRQLSRSDLRAAILKAVEEGDAETLSAVERAPRVLFQLESGLRAEVRALRLQLADFDPTRQREALGHRERIAEKARKALGAPAR